MSLYIGTIICNNFAKYLDRFRKRAFREQIGGFFERCLRSVQEL